MSKGVATNIPLQPPPPHSTSEPDTVMVQWQKPNHPKVSSQIAQSVIAASFLSFICCSGYFRFSIVSPKPNSGPSSKPTNCRTAHFNEKSPVHSLGFVVSPGCQHCKGDPNNCSQLQKQQQQQLHVLDLAYW